MTVKALEAARSILVSEDISCYSLTIGRDKQGNDSSLNCMLDTRRFNASQVPGIIEKARGLILNAVSQSDRPSLTVNVDATGHPFNTRGETAIPANDEADSD